MKFEQGRFYVEPHQSVLFFAHAGQRRLHCYVTREALMTYFGAKDDALNAYKHCLCAYDRYTATIQSIAERLIGGDAWTPDGAITITPDAVFRNIAALEEASAPAFA